MKEKISYKGGGNESAFFADLTSAIATSKPDREKEWKERRAERLTELEAQVAAIKAEIEEEAKPKKRLMTPAECAGKWLVHKEGDRHFIGSFKTDTGTIGICKGIWTPRQLQEQGEWKIADTPTSEPYSLEIEG